VSRFKMRTEENQRVFVLVTVSRKSCSRLYTYIIHPGSLDSEFQPGNIGEKQKPAALSTELQETFLNAIVAEYR
jgi:hypothetical protein